MGSLASNPANVICEARGAALQQRRGQSRSRCSRMSRGGYLTALGRQEDWEDWEDSRRPTRRPRRTRVDPARRTAWRQPAIAHMAGLPVEETLALAPLASLADPQ